MLAALDQLAIRANPSLAATKLRVALRSSQHEADPEQAVQGACNTANREALKDAGEFESDPLQCVRKLTAYAVREQPLNSR